MIVNDASRIALRQHSKITMEILETTIANTRPSLSVQELEKYKKIRAKMDGVDLTKQPPRRRIGF
jgi:transitional endoplasmic reticulum ATPase